MNDCEWEAAVALCMAVGAVVTLLLAHWNTTVAVVFVIGCLARVRHRLPRVGRDARVAHPTRHTRALRARAALKDRRARSLPQQRPDPHSPPTQKVPQPKEVAALPSHTTTLSPRIADIGYLDIRTDTTDRVDKLRLAVAGFLAGYSGSTLTGYRYDLNLFLTWCADPDHTVDPLSAKRGHVELYIRWLEQTGWATATIAKRYDTVRGFFKAADRDELLDGKDPCTWITRPLIDSDAQRRTVLQPLSFTLFLAAAKKLGPQYHAFAGLLGVNALRIAELCSLNIEDMTVEDGYDVIHFIGKGHKSASVPLSVPVMRAVRDAIDGRTEGPIVVTKWKTRMTQSTARRMVKEIARAAGVDENISPHSLRRSFATMASGMGIPIRDIQNTLRHASPSTTGIYIRDGKSHDRNSTHAVAAFMAGMSG